MNIDIKDLFKPEVQGKVNAKRMARAVASVMSGMAFSEAQLTGVKIRETKPSLHYRSEYVGCGWDSEEASVPYFKRGQVFISSTVDALDRVANLQSAPGRLLRVGFNELQDLVNDLRVDNISPNLSGMINVRLHIAGQAFTAAVNTTVDRTLPLLHGKPNKLPTHISEAQGKIIASRLYHHVIK
jgi:hypothetical protein